MALAAPRCGSWAAIFTLREAHSSAPPPSRDPSAKVTAPPTGSRARQKRLLLGFGSSDSVALMWNWVLWAKEALSNGSVSSEWLLVGLDAHLCPALRARLSEPESGRALGPSEEDASTCVLAPGVGVGRASLLAHGASSEALWLARLRVRSILLLLRSVQRQDPNRLCTRCTRPLAFLNRLRALHLVCRDLHLFLRDMHLVRRALHLLHAGARAVRVRRGHTCAAATVAQPA